MFDLEIRYKIKPEEFPKAKTFFILPVVKLIYRILPAVEAKRESFATARDRASLFRFIILSSGKTNFDSSHPVL